MATIVARGNKWQAKVRRDGYPPMSKSFARRSDAESWARQQEAEMDRGAWRDRSSADSTTFYKLLERYAKDVSPTKRGADVEKLRIEALMRDDIARYKLSGLSPLVLAEWRDRRLAAGCAGATVRRELDIVSAVMNWARRELMIEVENPVAGIRRPPPSRTRERRFEGDEEARLLKALEDHADEDPASKAYRKGSRNPYIKPLVRLATATAMRRGELLSLQWRNVDLEARTAHLPETKNGDSRTVPLSTTAVAILRELQDLRDKRAKKNNSDVDNTVFPISIAAIKKCYQRALSRARADYVAECEKAGTKPDDRLLGLRLHDLRHEATSRLAERLDNILELSAVTGHRDIRMLKRYYHPRASDLAKKLG